MNEQEGMAKGSGIYAHHLDGHRGGLEEFWNLWGGEGEGSKF